jgi:hypothetical protein
MMSKLVRDPNVIGSIFLFIVVIALSIFDSAHKSYAYAMANVLGDAAMGICILLFIIVYYKKILKKETYKWVKIDHSASFQVQEYLYKLNEINNLPASFEDKRDALLKTVDSLKTYIENK